MTRQVVKLSTLKPDELRSSDFTELSHKTRHTVQFADITKSPGQIVWPNQSQHQSRPRFPDHARGFFYYYSPVGFSQMASSIRFRCTSSNDPATFNQGKDLLTHFGLPWESSMPSILRARSSYVQDYLVHAGLVTEDQITHLKHIVNGRQLDRVLWRFDLPFLINFDRTSISHYAVVGSLCEKIKFPSPSVDKRGRYSYKPGGDSYKRMLPYKGSF
jgi:hypothetical protein